MEDKGRHEIDLASRKAEEAALRRFQAIHWLEYLEGPLSVSSQASEREFLAFLRNGLILCNVMNKVQPGSVPKVVDNHLPSSQSVIWDSQPLPAYQYFENIRNFLVAVENLRLPTFEASVFDKENIEAGSSAKVVDCILALKAYDEWKQMTGGNGVYRPPRSPLTASSVGRINGRNPVTVNPDSRRRLDMSDGCSLKSETGAQNLENLIVKSLAERMVDVKENINVDIFHSHRSDNMNPTELLTRILSCCVEDQQVQSKFPQDHLQSVSSNCSNETKKSQVPSTSGPFQNSISSGDQKGCRASSVKGKRNQLNRITLHEKELWNLKVLLSNAKRDLEDLQCQLQSDLKLLGDQVLVMSTAALGYQKVVKENRNLFNMVQDLKGSIRVYCRIRPAEAKSVIDFIGEDGSLVVVDPLKPHKDGRKRFQFNRIFGPTATQEEVFTDTKPLIRSVMDGYNVCIFAYGQTGSGKTYTMSGPSIGPKKEFGINQLALNDLFQLSFQRRDIMKYDISVQMVEIYNEQIRDLLAEDLSATAKLEVRTCVIDSGLVLPDATLLPVKSTSDVLNLMRLGEANRAVCSTAMNNQSSRSHSVLSVHVHGEDESGNKLQSCLNLVDLAGSERVDKSEVTGDGLKEAQHINKSLSCLGDVITALAQKSSFVPYRNSKLTLLLQSCLGGNAKTLMFAHVSPEEGYFGETLSTLKFAQRASTVELGAARSNKESSEVLELKAQVESLKKALASRGGASSQMVKPNEAACRTPPSQKPKTALGYELTTPPPQTTTGRRRRLSVENCTAAADKAATPLPQPSLSVNNTKPGPRSRRLSLEGHVLPLPISAQSAMESVLRRQMEKTGAIRTPEPVAAPTPTNGKGSQIRRSLRTIGKLINGSDKRNQKEEAAKSPVAAAAVSNGRTLRRQSLTGILPPENSRRSSIGWK
ncbi:unnamed protein product [Cuscuta epithymum]|uniref:Uncharacterized protein n=2 Tax=Cuscuta epithymum TaxID=186058 RepID=A0AAV0C5N3_9ASTE|nr:unnamed protein product [Cuscuta epithymum]